MSEVGKCIEHQASAPGFNPDSAILTREAASASYDAYCSGGLIMSDMVSIGAVAAPEGLAALIQSRGVGVRHAQSQDMRYGVVTRGDAVTEHIGEAVSAEVLGDLQDVPQLVATLGSFAAIVDAARTLGDLDGRCDWLALAGNFGWRDSGLAL